MPNGVVGANAESVEVVAAPRDGGDASFVDTVGRLRYVSGCHCASVITQTSPAHGPALYLFKVGSVPLTMASSIGVYLSKACMVVDTISQ